MYKRQEKYAAELAGIIGCDPNEVLRVSAKTGEGVRDLLDQIVTQIPAPVGDPGDLYAIVQLVLPPELSERERTLMQELAAASTFNPRAHHS